MVVHNARWSSLNVGNGGESSSYYSYSAIDLCISLYIFTSVCRSGLYFCLNWMPLKLLELWVEWGNCSLISFVSAIWMQLSDWKFTPC
jgi:hypothetical protein